MDLKTFRGPSIQVVLREVRAELGEQALLLDTRERRGPDGKRTIEVVAARDRTPPSTATAGATPGTAPEELSFEDLAALCGLAQAAAATASTPGAPFPGSPGNQADALQGRLVAQGVRPAVARRLVEEAQSPPGRPLAEALAERVAAALGATLPATSSRPRVVALVGPTGVGKTTTAAKLAARLRLGLGAQVALVAADCYRIGAVEQLRIYADLLGVPFAAAASPDQLDRAVQQLAGLDWVLVDTAGASPREAAHESVWAPFFAERPWLERLLLLAANVREDDLDAAVDAYWGLGPTGLVFTKIDEASQLGAVLNQAVRTGLKVGFLTNGQSVPGDLLVTTPRHMADLVLGVRTPAAGGEVRA